MREDTVSARRLRIIVTTEACRICILFKNATTAVAKKVLCALLCSRLLFLSCVCRFRALPALVALNGMSRRYIAYSCFLHARSRYAFSFQCCRAVSDNRFVRAARAFALLPYAINIESCQHLETVSRPYVLATTQCAVVRVWVTGFRPKAQTSVGKPRSVHVRQLS